MKGQQIIICPNCGENKVKNSGIGKMFLWFAVISAITIIGIPLAIVFFLAWIFVRYVQKDNLRMICMQCKHMFKVDESTYDRYKQSLNNKLARK